MANHFSSHPQQNCLEASKYIFLLTAAWKTNEFLLLAHLPRKYFCSSTSLRIQDLHGWSKNEWNFVSSVMNIKFHLKLNKTEHVLHLKLIAFYLMSLLLKFSSSRMDKNTMNFLSRVYKTVF